MDLSKKTDDKKAKGAGGSPPPPPASPAPHQTPPPPVRHSKQGDLHIVGQTHETVIYHGDDVLAKPTKEEEDEDDSFYEVTLDDVKSHFKDLQRKRETLEDAPLKGQKIRALEKETALLKNLHDHPNTAIRIRFPDRLVIQGIFRTSDTISNIKTWLKEYLHNPNLEFYLFTAPPKKILQDEVKLVDEGLVAKVVVYFGSSTSPEKALKPELYSKLSDPEKAFELAKSKLRVRKRESESDDGEIRPSTETQPKDHSGGETSRPQQATRRPVDSGKIPKWFKTK